MPCSNLIASQQLWWVLHTRCCRRRIPDVLGAWAGGDLQAPESEHRAAPLGQRAGSWRPAWSNRSVPAACCPAWLRMTNRPMSQSASATLSRYPGRSPADVRRNRICGFTR